MTAMPMLRFTMSLPFCDYRKKHPTTHITSTFHFLVETTCGLRCLYTKPIPMLLHFTSRAIYRLQWFTHAIVAHCQEFEVWFGRGKFHKANLEMTVVCDRFTKQWSEDLTMGEQYISPTERTSKSGAGWAGAIALTLQ